MSVISGMRFPVHKKSSPNEKVTILLESREITDLAISGVVVLDEKYLSDRCIFIFIELICFFRYGRKADEMFGLKFMTESIISSEQLFPLPQIVEVEENETNSAPSAMQLQLQQKLKQNPFQERVVRKFGAHRAFPFNLAFRGDSPSSVTIETGEPDDKKGKSVGLSYFLKAYAGEHEKDYSNKNGTVQMAIKKVQLAPQKKKRKDSLAQKVKYGKNNIEESSPMAKTTVKKEFFMSKGELELNVSLDKQIYYHGDTLKVVVQVNNRSTKTVRKYKTFVEQTVNMSVFKNGRRKNVITSFEETEYGVPIPPGGKLNTFVHLTPILDDNKGRSGIAKDAQLRSEEGTTLASSSLFADPDDDDAFGILIGYCVKVKLYCGLGGGVLIAKVPFFLMHPPPGTVTKSSTNRFRRTQSLYY